MPRAPVETKQRNQIFPKTKTRNTNRGLRSKESIVLRNRKRSFKRKHARRLARMNREGKFENENRRKFQATAQEPQNQFDIAQVRYAENWKIATINMRGAKKQGKREEIETWMKANQIDIAHLQETRLGENSREARKEFTWFFSGENRIQNEYTAGVGIIVKNTNLQYLEDIEPVSDRTMWARWKSILPITTINTHIPQAMRSTEEKETVYQEIRTVIKKNYKRGPIILAGDLNARMQKATNRTEQHIMGKWTFEPETARIHGRTEGILENRNLLIELCTEFELILCNTYFKKQNTKLATFREVGTTLEEPVTRGKYEQLNFIITQRRWKNMVTNCESDMKANIDTDHYPVTATYRIKLKAVSKAKKNQRETYEDCTEQDTTNINKTFKASRKRQRDQRRNHDEQTGCMNTDTEHNWRQLKTAIEQATNEIPKKKRRVGKTAFSEQTLDILNLRQEAVTNRNTTEFARLTKEFRKSKQKDKMDMIN